MLSLSLHIPTPIDHPRQFFVTTDFQSELTTQPSHVAKSKWSKTDFFVAAAADQRQQC